MGCEWTGRGRGRGGQVSNVGDVRYFCVLPCVLDFGLPLIHGAFTRGTCVIYSVFSFLCYCCVPYILALTGSSVITRGTRGFGPLLPHCPVPVADLSCDTCEFSFTRPSQKRGICTIFTVQVFTVPSRTSVASVVPMNYNAKVTGETSGRHRSSV